MRPTDEEYKIYLNEIYPVLATVLDHKNSMMESQKLMIAYQKVLDKRCDEHGFNRLKLIKLQNRYEREKKKGE